MEKKRIVGFIQLAKKSLAVITASFGTLISNQTKALPDTPNIDGGDKNMTCENFQKRILKPKLVLKLRLNDPENFIMAMHVSHSSHSSHSSHASHISYSPPPGHYSHSSHVSHASHYSSSPSYTPSVPSYTPSTSVPKSTSNNPTYMTPKSLDKKSVISDTTEININLPYYTLGSRNLYQGCKGVDVQELQQLLINRKYYLTADGVFGAKTKEAVIKFQKENYLIADGTVGTATLSAIQSK